MPLFEYYCPKCNFKFEQLVKLEKNAKITPCPNCKNRKTVKLFSAFGFKSGSNFISSAPKGCGSCSSSHCSSCG